MNHNNFRIKAIELINEAVKEDKNKNFEEAYNYYNMALNYFRSALNYENESTKVVILQYINQYISRAEEIKNIIENSYSSSSSTKNNKKEGRDKITENTNNDNNNDSDIENNNFRSLISKRKIEENLNNNNNIKWDDIIGMNKIKEILYDTIILYQEIKHFYVDDCKPIKGILLYGPPGNGKTFIIQGLSSICKGYSFYNITSADLISKWVGDSAKHIRALFEEIKSNKPSVLFIDEIDSICTERSNGNNGGSSSHNESSNALTEFITQMEGFNNDMDDVLIIGATNLPNKLDKAVRSRFQKRIYIPLPDKITRKSIFKNKLKNVFNILTEDDYDQLSILTENYSNRDIYHLIGDTLKENIKFIKYSTHFKPINNNKGEIIPCSPSDKNGFEMFFEDIQNKKLIIKPPLSLIHFYLVLSDMKPSVNQNDLNQYIEFTKLYGQDS